MTLSENNLNVSSLFTTKPFRKKTYETNFKNWITAWNVAVANPSLLHNDRIDVNATVHAYI